ncbi:uncharacterized protein LOC101846474 [Aplysia californica]|uniref:Uncharacterized protein LOC101846474 n=1 Tax=Aplysia californica TaxID=6500 RepID=A0ABM0JBS1_APLCA|nr:uncharacterized protein LOC101846474 [Aplysia californica]
MTGSSRTKSAPSYRALGTRSPACASHENAEYEYSFVKAIVDAMTSEPAERPTPRPQALPSTVWPPMYLSHNPGSPPIRQPEAPPIYSKFKRRQQDNRSYSILPTPAYKQPRDSLFPPQHTPLLPRRMNQVVFEGKSVLTTDVGLASKRRQGQFFFNGPTLRLGRNAENKTTVLPMTSLSHTPLQLNGDGKQVLSSNVSKSLNNYQGIVTFGMRKAETKTQPQSSLPQSHKDQTPRYDPVIDQSDKLALITQTGVADEEKVTKYRFRIRSPSSSGTPPRPSTSPEARHKMQNKLLNRRSEVSSVLKKTEKNNPQLISIDATPMIAKPKGVESVGTLSLGTPRVTGEQEGRTMLTKTPGSLTLSVFLPRESSDSARMCTRQSDTDAKTRQLERGGKTPTMDKPKVTNSVVKNVTNEVCVLDDNVKQTLPPTTYPRHVSETAIINEVREANDVTKGVFKSDIGGSFDHKTDLRRAIHCELFGPDLCGDCQKVHEKEEITNWQESNYPKVTGGQTCLVANQKANQSQALPSSGRQPQVSITSNQLLVASSLPKPVRPQDIESGSSPAPCADHLDKQTWRLSNTQRQGEVKERKWDTFVSPTPKSKHQAISMLQQ